MNEANEANNAQASKVIIVPDHGESFQVQLMLCNAAEIRDNLLYILGGCITIIGTPATFSLACVVHVPWHETNREQQIDLLLVDADGRQVEIDGTPVSIHTAFEVGRPAGTRPGVPLHIPLHFSFQNLPLPENETFRFELLVNKQHYPGSQVSFITRAIET